jgi:hypothetical protein
MLQVDSRFAHGNILSGDQLSLCVRSRERSPEGMIDLAKKLRAARLRPVAASLS